MRHTYFVKPLKIVATTALCAVAIVTWTIPTVADGKARSSAIPKKFSKIEAHCNDLKSNQPNAKVGDPVVAYAFFKKSVSSSRQQDFSTTFNQAVGLCFEDTQIIGSSPSLFAVIGSRSDKTRYEAFVVLYLRRAGLFSFVSRGQGSLLNLL